MPVSNINAAQLKELLKDRSQVELIDVRQKYEYDIIHLRNSKLIQMDELAARQDEIDWNKQVVFICRSGSRSKMMANILGRDDKEIKNLKYGIYECYKEKDYPDLEVLSEKVKQYF